MSVRTTPGDQVRALRLALGASQPAFAGMVGVTPVTISRWEIAGTEPGPTGNRPLGALQKAGAPCPPKNPTSEVTPFGNRHGFRRKPRGSGGCRGSQPAHLRPHREPGICNRNIADRPAAASASGGLRPHPPNVADPLPVGR